VIRWKWNSWSRPANGLILASLFLLSFNVQAQEGTSDAKSAASQPGYGFHQTSWQAWPSKNEAPGNRPAVGAAQVEPPKPLPQTSHVRRGQTTATSMVTGAPIVRRRVVESAPAIQPVTYVEQIATKRPSPSAPITAPVPSSSLDLQPLNWVASPASVPAQPKESPTIERVKTLPALEATPAIIEWVPIRPSASSYKPQS
jgi:hypothetical protein